MALKEGEEGIPYTGNKTHLTFKCIISITYNNNEITMKRKHLALAITIALGTTSAFAKDHNSSEDNEKRGICKDVPSYSELKSALDASDVSKTAQGGFGFQMWGTIVNRDGFVCAVAFTGKDRGDQWPGSRAISAAKAYTANAYSLPGFALSTANLYASGQPGGSLWGLQFSNPLDTKAAYRGNPKRYGKANDPMVGKKVGGQIVFGGGFALYNSEGKIVGGVGVSGDSSCKDHNFGWNVRYNLGYDHVPAGINTDATRPDNIIYDMGGASTGAITSGSGFGHTDCGLGENAVSTSLPMVP